MANRYYSQILFTLYVDVSIGRRRKYSPGFWVSLFAVATWSYAGVIVRFSLSELEKVILRSAPDREGLRHIGFGEGFYFANIVGCVLLGALNKISERWRWFSKGPIWAVNKTGFGTGFCGSCTTFSSWSFHAAKGFFNGYASSAVFSLIVGVTVWCGSYELGTHIPDLILTPTPKEQQCGRQGVNGARNSDDNTIGIYHQKRRNVEGQHIHCCQQSAPAVAALKRVEEGCDVSLTEDKKDTFGGKITCPNTLTTSTITTTAATYTGNNVKTAAAAKKDCDSEDNKSAGTPIAPPSSSQYYSFTSNRSIEIHWIIIWATLTFLWWLLAFLVDAETNDHCNEIFLGMALAPAGACLRWFLGRFNKKPTPSTLCCSTTISSSSSPPQHSSALTPASLCDVSTWNFPFYTFLANMLGCILLAVLVVTDESGPCAQQWETAEKLGITGSLSTVSTFISEARGLSRKSPWLFYRYIITTIVCTEIAMLIIYGSIR
mmetsp:Transcript_45139/g.72593  ORF Transcript_45139/g.72593 Transcript_45139/m.72593 type:complete len:489 (+) Transcript_45139:429-1895(+)